MKQSYHFLFIFFLICFTSKLYSQSVLLTGDLRYDNANLTPLAGVPVQLKTLLGNVVAADTTDSSGNYSMSGFANGNYILDAQIGYNSGGFNSTDALLVNRYFTSLVSLTPLRAKAGDVNGNQITNSGDALLISRRMTNALSSFAVGNYVSDKPSINAQGNPLSVSMRALSTGDVNGSFNVQPSAPNLVLDTVYGNGNVGTAVVRFTNPGSGVFERGIVWSSSPNPTISSNRSVAGKGGFDYTHSFSTIDPNNIQYARAYARTSAGVYYSPERSFTPIPGIRCPGTPSVTDIDGNLYHTVQIGNQCWIQSNLKVSKYRNGNSIPIILSGLDTFTTTGAYTHFYFDSSYNAWYGKLYNHFAVMDTRGLCPTGWHVPTIGEWNSLEALMGSPIDVNLALRSAVNYSAGGWATPGATNASGFSAEPGGLFMTSGWNQGGFDGFFGDGFFGGWWSSSLSGSYAEGRSLCESLGACGPEGVFGAERTYGLSVRCIRDSSVSGGVPMIPTVITGALTAISSNSATMGGIVISDGGSPVIARGVAYGTAPNPNIYGTATNNGAGIGTFSSNLIGLVPSTNYYVRAYATNAVGTSYGIEDTIAIATPGPQPQPCPNAPFVTDVDGNTYNTVQIGTQCWTQSNLKVSKYRNGDTIPTGLSNSDWGNTTVGAYAIYDNNPVNDGLYGKLYNHYAVMDTRGLCPTGWHVPVEGEWSALATHLGGNTVAGSALKSTLTQPTPGGWNYTWNVQTYSPFMITTNSSGFSGGPGGLRNHSGGFNFVGNNGFWWSSSLNNFNFSLENKDGDIYYNNVFNTTRYPNNGSSIRCLKDTGLTVSTSLIYGITSTSANTGGYVTQDGGVPVTSRGMAYGTSSSPTISGTITNEGTGLGIFTSTLTGLTPTTTYYVRAYATNSVGTAYGNEFVFSTFGCPGTPSVTDIDGNSYHTVQIGTQCWTQSNLKVSKYRNGDNIPTGLSNTAWENTTAGAYAIYNNDPVNDGLYGKLYNHYAVMDTRGLCPTGWHVPTDGEWTTLETFLGGSSVAGGALKSTDTQPTPGGWGAHILSAATNSSGFTAGPGGLRYVNGGFNGVGVFGFWWSSSLSGNDAWNLHLTYGSGGVARFNANRATGFSVRCLRD